METQHWEEAFFRLAPGIWRRKGLATALGYLVPICLSLTFPQAVCGFCAALRAPALELFTLGVGQTGCPNDGEENES